MSKGTISISTENIFPIIKKWLYSDKDIFLRELVSNGCDAVTKIKKLESLGEADLKGDNAFKVEVICDKENGKLIISDNGIGMTAEEVDKYINQVAFSGAADFLEKYKENTDDNSQIIGHFGLGFYSAFMVADTVTIDSLSYADGAKPVKWICNGGMEYEISEGERKERGTTITLFINEDSKEFLQKYTVRAVLTKYCAFLPTEVYLKDTGEKKEEAGEDGKEPEAPKPINDTDPLWMKNPKDCTDEDYNKFYTKVFTDFNPPLFWIHLNVDYPFNLKGILYFPKYTHELNGAEGQIKLYNNQVFVADNVKEVMPEFLMLLKGTIDCPDLPLNVSRSFLQNDGYVKKISAHITKKIADKLTELYNKERDNYNSYWEDINIFIKYGCIKEDKFYDKVKDILLYKDINGKYVNLKEYFGDGESKDVYYVSDETQQVQYINMFKEQGLNAVILPNMIDTHFISFIESKEENVKFKRIDSKLSDELTENNPENADEDKAVCELFKKNLNNDELKVEVQALKNKDMPALLLLSEESRRMQDMYRPYAEKMGGMTDMFKDDFTLVLNKNNELIEKIDGLNEDDAKLVCEHIYDLALLSNKPLSAEQMTKFIERSNIIMSRIL
ncbi:MAG: molecular chaperone HtpG [Oscillospiraceae bacterium]|nr:molecular chaperone HtpG [Oscillospiraceae bacterium]